MEFSSYKVMIYGLPSVDVSLNSFFYLIRLFYFIVNVLLYFHLETFCSFLYYLFVTFFKWFFNTYSLIYFISFFLSCFITPTILKISPFVLSHFLCLIFSLILFPSHFSNLSWYFILFLWPFFFFFFLLLSHFLSAVPHNHFFHSRSYFKLSFSIIFFFKLITFL